MNALHLDGASLTPEALALAAGGPCAFTLDAAGVARMRAARVLIDRAIAEGEPVYGVTTGLGARVGEALDAATLADFSQQTLLGRAHAVGDAAPMQVVRAAMIVRLNTLLCVYSGTSPDLAEHLLRCLNAGLTPVVGALGSIGAGDLVLMATMGLALTGQGRMQALDGRIGDAAEMMQAAGIAPLRPGPRDGLALANNSCMTAAAAALALAACDGLYDMVQTAAAMSMEAFRANLTILDPAVLAAKPHQGEGLAAAGLRARLAGSSLFAPGAARRLQDPLSIRNAPQINGAMAAALEFARPVIVTEINSSSDNPLVLTGEDRIVSSGAYFTAELAQAVEALSRAAAPMAMAQLSRMSKHLDPVFSGLPVFLAPASSGANAFAPVMKVAEAVLADLLHDAQPVPIWPSLNANAVEDCQTTAPAAVKALHRICEKAATLTAMELMIATQALELRGVAPPPWLADVCGRVRQIARPLTEARPVGAEIGALADALRSGALAFPGAKER